jgi:hypothetical protein
MAPVTGCFARTRRAGGWIGALCLTTIVGCGSEPTYGSYRMSMSDDKQFELRGPAHTHKSFESGDAYRLALDLRGAVAKFREHNELAFVFDQEPDTGVWHLFTFGKPRPLSGRLAELSFDMGCFVPELTSDATLSPHWAFDSGTVHVTSPASQNDFTGSFRIFLHFEPCGPPGAVGRPDTVNSVIMLGAFETKRR